MITSPENSDAHLASAWTAGIACLFLGIGLSGAVTPLVPEVPTEMAKIDLGDAVMLEEFNAPSAAAAEAEVEPEPEELIEEIEIPPLPEMATPLTPPEMVELTPLQPVVEKPPVPRPKPVDPKPRPTERRPAAPSRPQGPPGSIGSGGGGSGEPQVFTGGGGGGRFPSPYYPASARTAGKQGSVRLLVTVEASGLPGSVSVSSSSGHSILDNAARDHVQRRWRWPAGPVRRYIVPIKFVLQ